MARYRFSLGSPPAVHAEVGGNEAVRSMAASQRSRAASARRSCPRALSELMDAVGYFGTALAHRRTGGMTPEVDGLIENARKDGKAAEMAYRRACGKKGRKPAKRSRKKSRRRGSRRNRRRDRHGRFV